METAQHQIRTLNGKSRPLLQRRNPIEALRGERWGPAKKRPDGLEQGTC
jgi:hypothetical protein